MQLENVKITQLPTTQQINKQQTMNVKIENIGFGNTYVVYRIHSNELVARFLRKVDAYEYIFKTVNYA